MSNSCTRIEHLQTLACILEATPSIKKHQANKSWWHLLVHVLLLLHLLNEWHDDFVNIVSIRLLSLARCAVQLAISSNANELLVQAASTFTSGTVLMVAPCITEHSDAKEPSFQKDGLHLLFQVGNIKGIKVLPRNIMSIRRQIQWPQLSCLLNDLHQLGILS